MFKLTIFGPIPSDLDHCDGTARNGGRDVVSFFQNLSSAIYQANCWEDRGFISEIEEIFP